MTVEVCLDHLASRWDRSAASLRADIDRSVKAGAHVISLTEVADGNRVKAVPTEGYRLLHDRVPWQAGEVAMLVRESFGQVVYWSTVQIGPDLGPGHAVYAIMAVIRHHDSGRRLLVADAHLPASVEGDWRGGRARAYRKAVRQYRRTVTSVRRKYRPDAEVVWADWNLNLNRGWVRAWVRGEWPRFAALGRPKVASRSSHAGGRLIDWPITTGLRRRRLTVLPLTPGSDHRGVRLRARIRRKRR